jgi:hypothetical protein
VAAPSRRRLLAPEFDAARAVALILQSYTRYLGRMALEDPADPKAIVGLHAAGRAVLAHAEHALKVAAMVGGGEAAPDLVAMLAEARADLGDNDSDEENDSDDLVGGEG